MQLSSNFFHVKAKQSYFSSLTFMNSSGQENSAWRSFLSEKRKEKDEMVPESTELTHLG